MKIYLDNNLGVQKVEQEELTQDTYGYNILKVYIPNAVLAPYDTFTCYYGALLQNGRKVGWFAMEARTNSDADYEANYTLYKATLEQSVVSVEGKVYIGCQVILGNSGNATLIKKNTAVVQFNVRKSVAINNDILILDPNQTNTDVLESYKQLLENALTTYATKAEVQSGFTEVDSKFAKKDGSNVDTFKANDFILDGVSLKDNLFYYSDNTDITNTLTLTNHYLDKANGNANPDSNSKCTGYIDLSNYAIFLISGHSQYATTLICTYDENKTFLRSYGDGTSAGQTFNDYEYTPQADEKFVRFSTYQYNQYPLKVVSLGNFLPINVKKQDNYLYKKKYVSCGDSFTAGDVISSDKVYPYLIAQRNNMQLVNMAHNGSYIHYGENGFTNQNNSYYYKNIPLDADIITIAYGLNETSTTIGTKESNDNTTIWGAYNEVLGWITTNIPNAKVGIISNDAWMTYELRNALQEIASYWGVEFLDLKEYGKPFMISGKYSQDGDTNSSVVTQRTNQYCVSSTNGHPNELGHKVRSYIIENFLRGAYGVNNSYTKSEVDSKLDLKANSDNVYSISQVENLLYGKADKSDTYTKQEVNETAIRIVNYIDEVRATTDTLYNETQVLRSDVDTLQNDVDNLKSVQNVVEVVSTYSALQSYDTSKLDVEDKVQVIADETHDGASTIYNWDGSAWYYVGSFGTNSYTKTEVDTKLSTKADKDDTYTKQEVNDKLNGYIKDNDTTYSATVRGKEVIVSAGEGYGSTTYKLNSIHTSNPRKPSCDYSFPNEKSGTLALTSDIPTVNNPTITFTQGGTTKGSFSLNQSSDQTIELDAGGSGGGSSVVANPTLSGDEATLNGLEVDGTKYKVGGSGSSGKLYLHKFRIKKNTLYNSSGSTIGTKLYLFYSIVTSSNEPITFDTFMNITHLNGYGAHFGTNITGDITITNTMRALNSFSSYDTNDKAEISYIDDGAILTYTNCIFDSVDIMSDTITEV